MMESGDLTSSNPLSANYKSKTKKWCFVPECKSTTIKNPNKVFFVVPQDTSIRKKWFSVARRADEPGKSNYFCCQDHFDLKSDMENYVRFQLYGGNLKLRSGVIPHKFECQSGRLLQSNDLNRHAYKKVNHQRAVQDVLHENYLQISSQAETISSQLSISSQLFLAAEHAPKDQSNNDQEFVETNNCEDCYEMEVNERFMDFINSNNGGRCADLGEPRGFGEGSITMERIQQGTYKKMVSFGTQTDLEKSNRAKPYHYRSKGVMCKPCQLQCNADAQIQVRMEIETSDKACSPVHSLLSDPKSLGHSSNPSSLRTPSDGSNYVPSTTSASSPEKGNSQNEKDLKFTTLNVTRYLISRKPKKYLGIPEHCMPWLMNLLKKHSNFSEDNIQLALMKIRMDDGYERLGDSFGISTSQASRIFHKVVPTLSHLMKTFIRQPPKHEVQRNLPIPFRAHYSNVYALIDAFETLIQKPSDPVHQALSWSDYKKGNTWKWIILCTPDGKILFVSKAYSGRVSDILLFEDCGVMDILPEGCTVMADRGFKNIEGTLRRKGIQLVRPPSVFSTSQPTREEVIETKKIAALRIHVERLIRRVREFKMLELHSCLDLNTAPLIDDIVQLVCGLINLQSPLIRT